MLPALHPSASFFPDDMRSSMHGGERYGFQFTNPAAHHFQPGMLYLGRDRRTGHDIGIRTEKGAITVASARTGKGAAQIIPNLLRWPGNSLTVDPSGENVAETWEALEARGVKVVALDPFREAKIPSRLRGSCNLLAGLDPAALTIREDIRVIADGLVMRSNPDHNDWADKRLEVIAGTIAHIVSSEPPEYRTLLDVVALLSASATPLPGHTVSPLEANLTFMRDDPGCAGLAIKGGSTALNSFQAKNKQGPEGAALGGASSELDWINSHAMGDILGGSSFDLSELKTGNIAVFLVLPPDYLDEHGRFLRLFVRCAISAMTKGGKVNELNPNGKLNRPCLFLLDEFFSLGHMQIIEKAAGLLPKNGVHLWPFLQDIGQLNKLYGKDAAGTFFGNSDVHCFFGNSDTDTLEFISNALGVETFNEAAPPPPLFIPTGLSPHEAGILSGSAVPLPDGMTVNSGSSYGSNNNSPHWNMIQGHSSGSNYGSSSGSSQVVRGPEYFETARRHVAAARLKEEIADRQVRERAYDDNEKRLYEHQLKRVGQPRLHPQEIRALVGKEDGDPVAKSMIVIGKGGDKFNLALAPYFLPSPEELRIIAALKAQAAKMLEGESAPPKLLPPTLPPYDGPRPLPDWEEWGFVDRIAFRKDYGKTLLDVLLWR